MNPINTGINPDKNWLFKFHSFTLLFNSSNFLSDIFLALYAFTTNNPEYISSIWEFNLPNSFCLALKYFCDLLNIIPININPIILDNIAVKAIIESVLNIINVDPANNVIDLTKLDKAWFKDIPTVSTSFVTLDKTSPIWLLSK